MVARLALTTDFSQESHVAFFHALRLAVHFRCKLDLIHISSPSEKGTWDGFPEVRQTLQAWGMLPGGAADQDVASMLGITVAKIEVDGQDAVNGLAKYVTEKRPQMIVAATHAKASRSKFFSGAITDVVAKSTHTPTLLIGPKAKPFVNQETGEMHLKSILLPVVEKPSPKHALSELYRLFDSFPMRVHMIHVNHGLNSLSYGHFEGQPVHVIEGPVVNAILEAADTYRADFVAMTTEGHHGFMDALRGSTTSRVLHDVHCPVLAMPPA